MKRSKPYISILLIVLGLICLFFGLACTMPALSETLGLSAVVDAIIVYKLLFYVAAFFLLAMGTAYIVMFCLPNSKPSLEKREHYSNMYFLLPTAVLFTVVVLVPFIQGIPYSLTQSKSITSLTNPKIEHPWYGLKYYSYLLGDRWFYVEDGVFHICNINKYFGTSLAVTFHFTFLYVIMSNLLGFALALMIQRSSKFNNISRTIFFLPFTISVSAGSIIWKYLYIDLGNILGFTSPISVPSSVVPGMAAMASWRDMGYCMLIYIAALQTVSQDYYEAATVEGANAWQKFWKITIPMIVPAFTTNITLILSWGLRTFDLSVAVSSNMEAGQTTAFYIYMSIFQNNKAGLGQAAAIILTIILIVLTQLVTRVLRRLEVEA